MEKSDAIGMQTFDNALFKLMRAGTITEDEAIKNSDSPNNLKLKIKLNDSQAATAASNSGLSLEDVVEEVEEEIDIDMDFDDDKTGA